MQVISVCAFSVCALVASRSSQRGCCSRQVTIVKGHTDVQPSIKLRLVRHSCRTCRCSVYNELFDDDGRLERRVSRPLHLCKFYPLSRSNPTCCTQGKTTGQLCCFVVGMRSTHVLRLASLEV